MQLLIKTLLFLLLASSLYALDNNVTITKKPTPIYSYKHDTFSLNFSAGAILDYTTFNQDQNNITQVGIQENQLDLRAARALVYGAFDLFNQKIGYFVSCGFSDYLTRDADTICRLYDATLFYNLPNDGGRIAIGKMKEPWSYEMVGYSVSLIQHERFLSPLFQSRNIGLRYNNSFFKKQSTFAIGMYNDSARSISSRATYIPYISDDNMNYLHIGASLRYNDTLHYRGKPESYVTDWYVDTGEIDAVDALEFGLELLWSYNGVSILGEYLQSNINVDGIDPKINGWYVTTGWVLSGESRPYNKNVGFATRIIPRSNYGALELIARYGDVDLDDKFVQGGKMNKWMLGANWWVDPYLKASISYGTVELNRFDLIGETDIMLFRLQWFK